MEPSIASLIAVLSRLPGIGERTATRLAVHMLERDHDLLGALEQASAAARRVGHCERCRRFTSEPLCGICRDAGRDERDWCVVEHDRMIDWIEAKGDFRGVYFVLHGRLSPLGGVGVEELGVETMLNRAKQERPRRVRTLLADSVEGRLTAQVLGRRIRDSLPEVDLIPLFIAHDADSPELDFGS